MKLFSNPHRQPIRTISGDAPLRIGFFADTYAPQINGISISLQLLTESLRAAGHQVVIFAPRFPEYCDSDPDVHRIPSVAYMQSPAFYMSVPGTPRTSLAIRRCEFDVLHVHSPLSTGVMAYVTAKAKHAPLVYTYHTAITDYVHYLNIGGHTGAVRKAARWFSTGTANLTDRVITPSAKIKDLLLKEHVKRPIHVIPNGIDLGRFQQPNDSSRFRRQLGLARDAQLLLSLGRLAPEKSLPLLIDAFAHIAARFPNAHLVFAGDGSSRGELEAQAVSCGYAQRIHFLGMVARADLPDLLHEADLFLSASTSETQCVAMAEAIAASLPIVAVADKAFAGMFTNGVNGLAAPNDAQGFGAVVCNLLADPEKLRQFGRNSLELSHNFSVETQAAALVELYREAILEKSTLRHKRRFIPNPLTRSIFERSNL
jgi:glycosyltransferase involved in cell wall biosynthesis